MTEKAIYQIRTTSESDSMLTERAPESYFSHFDLEPEDLKDKSILDVGSGKHEWFADHMKEYGAEVYSINPKLRYKWQRDHLNKNNRNHGKAIAARAQEIPFASESFDLVLSHWAIPAYIPNRDGEIITEDGKIILQELCRVVKHGGSIRLFPIDTETHFLRKPEKIITLNFGFSATDWFKSRKDLSVKTMQTVDGISLIILRQ